MVRKRIPDHDFRNIMRGMFDPLAAQAHHSALRSISRVVEETTAPMEEGAALEGVVKLLEAGSVLAVTGAGVSTDSGIPDYRSPRGSLNQGRPMTYQEFRFDPVASHRYWARSFVGWRVMADAQPNRTHYALVELERAGLLTGMVTQNVDGLHRRAGSENLVALHGDLATIVCLQCGHREARELLDARLDHLNPGYFDSIALDPAAVNPDGDLTLDDHHVQRFIMVGCARCGSVLLKPDVVYFGEPVPSIRKTRVAQLLDGADAVVVAGSSLAVMSGYRIVIEAQRAGKPVAVINGGPGRADHRVDILWRTRVGPAFDQILDALDL